MIRLSITKGNLRQGVSVGCELCHTARLLTDASTSSEAAAKQLFQGWGSAT